MQIINPSKNLKDLEKLKDSNFINEALQKIVNICAQHDKSFFLKENELLNQLNSNISEVNKKSERQTALLNQSNTLILDFKKKYDLLKNENEMRRIKLLENLGSSL